MPDEWRLSADLCRWRIIGTIFNVRILVVGGSGYVAGLILPLIQERHTVRILDPRPPAGRYDHAVGDATDHRALAASLDRVDVVIHCAMGPPTVSSPDDVASAFDVNVKSVHVTLATAHVAGIRHAIYISSMSVYENLTVRRLDERVPPDAGDPYGLTKRLGEEVCRTAVAQFGMSVNVLRLAWPTPDHIWPAWGRGRRPRIWRTPAGTPIHGTAATDVARAVLAALDYRNGFEIFHISGDDSARLWSTAKARRLLAWAPTRAG